MDNYYSKITQDEINKCYQRYAGTEDEKDRNNNEGKFGELDSEIIIDDTTIYEIDLNCIECLQNRMKNKKYNY